MFIVCLVLWEIGEKVFLFLICILVGRLRRRRIKLDLIMDICLDVKYNEGLFVEYRKISVKVICG